MTTHAHSLQPQAPPLCLLNPCGPALVWRSLVVYETTKHWKWKEGIINHFKLAVANTKGKRALAIIERAARVRIARRQTSRTAPADRR